VVTMAMMRSMVNSGLPIRPASNPNS
jgi:hypothetical protein